MKKTITFEEYFAPYVDRYAEVSLDEEHSVKLATRINKLIKAEEKTLKRKLEPSEIKKYEKIFLGGVGDVVMEQFLDLDFVDYNLIGKTGLSQINKAFAGKTNVVTFTHGVFPLVYEKTYHRTIFICKLTKKDYLICGIASAKTVNNFTDKSLVVSDYLREFKTAFYGFNELSVLPSYLGDFIRTLNEH